MTILPYALTIFVSAFLLFQVQPVIARAILPWFGGSAAIWATCLLFFQVVLLLGYLYAYALVRWLKPRAQGTVHLALLGLSVLVLPMVPSPHWKPTGAEDPSLRILLLLLATVGLPYFLLSTTSPLLQAWYVRARHAAFPYRLFALSNFGSMLALLSYPTLVEPRLPTRAQEMAWTAAYAVFLLLAGAMAARCLRDHEEPAGADAERLPEDPPPSAGRQFFWLTLSACPSILLMAVTTHQSQDVAAIPFLWVMTLSLYLLSFILCFESDRWYQRWLFLPLLVATFAGMAYMLADDYQMYNLKQRCQQLKNVADLAVLVPLYSLGLFAACMVCNGELARLKPAPRYLTRFYLMVSLGGAIGGAFVALAAPALFAGYHEMQIGMVGCAILATAAMRRDAWQTESRWQWARRGGWGVLVGLSVTLAVILVREAGDRAAQYRVMVRNFYGGLRVSDSGQGPDAVRTLKHGIIIHGEQYMTGKMRYEPITYYARKSGVGLTLANHHRDRAQKVGAIGLGAGTLAAYSRPGDDWRFYEINPLVPMLARSQFYFLGDSRARIEIAMGDARLSLEREAPQGFDVLVVDAFSGDAIPVHLLTREAFELYFSHLKPDGVLAVHISNKYLDLEPVVERLARELGLQAAVVESEEDGTREIYNADWILVTRSQAFLDLPAIKEAARAPQGKAGLRPWTDDYSNLIQILK